ncbi:MAG: hypothetical protein ABFR89_07825 [Actinomycetota bacterium]
MRRTIAILAAIVAATLALSVVPALAVDDAPPERPRLDRERPERTFPPDWVGQSADEVRDAILERIEAAEERIADNERLTDEQKEQLLEALADTREAIEDLDEPAEIVGTAISRRQLERIEFRALRSGEEPDFEAHIAKDLEGFSLRLEHMTKIVGWAEAAGEDVDDVLVYLDEATDQLEVAEGTGSVEKRHDAAHIARAWMTEATVALMAL